MDKSATRVLLIESDPNEAALVGRYLADPLAGKGGFLLTHAPRLSTACHFLAREEFDAVLIDLVLPQTVGLEGFHKIRTLKPSVPIIVLSGLQDEALAAQAVGLGAQDYLIKGTPDFCVLKRSIRYAIELMRLSREAAALRDAAPTDQLKTLQAEARERLRVAEVKNHFMSRVSHEMRNTLATLKTAAYCLKEDATASLTARQARLVEMISRNVDRQTKILGNILDLARFQSGKLKIRFRPVNVALVIDEIVQEYGLTDSGRKLAVEVGGRLPSVKGDPDLIAQVLRNLVDNALRFAKERVTINASKTGSEGVCVNVVDDGAGIPPEKLGELFTQFVQLDHPGGDGLGHKGAGLGLTICKEIVEGHRGKIWAENVRGKGARFSVVLPAYGPDRGEPETGLVGASDKTRAPSAP